jgi:hypothetical protein
MSAGKSFLYGRANGAELTSPGQRPGYMPSQRSALKGRRIFYHMISDTLSPIGNARQIRLDTVSRMTEIPLQNS